MYITFFLTTFYYFILSGQSFKAILFDVDSKDATVGMSCPPIEFLDAEVLEIVKASIRDNGNYYITFSLKIHD